MTLLPKTCQEFGHTKYWDEFFITCRHSFEWYGKYEHFALFLNKYIRMNDSILNIGCGNSNLSSDMYDVGYRNQISIDVSEKVINKMKIKNEKLRPFMKFYKMSVLELDFSNEYFSCVLDKGTLDAILVDTSDGVLHKIEKMFLEISRILKFGGRYICISLLQNHVLQKLMDWFYGNGWLIRIHRCFKAEEEYTNCIRLPIFIIVVTKLKSILESPPILELDVNGNTYLRMDSIENTKNIIHSLQQYAFMRHKIQSTSFVNSEFFINFYVEENEQPRYTFYIEDNPKKKLPTSYAVFIVPQGREVDWLYSSVAGRKKLLQSTVYDRLLIVHLNCQHTYTNIDQIKEELSTKVMDFSPYNMSCKQKIPFLSLDKTSESKQIVHSGKSLLSGSYIIEDVTVSETQLLRHLIFLQNPNVIQSEVKINLVESSHIKIIDHSYLSCQHHCTIVAALRCFFWEQCDLHVLIIGLGGGGLSSFLYRHWPQIKQDVIEIDEEIKKVACQWFGFSENINVHICDEGKYDAVIIDTDSKDVGKAVSCPPPGFVEFQFLNHLKNILKSAGIMIMNIVSRDQELLNDITYKIKDVYLSCFQLTVEEDVNIIALAPKLGSDFFEPNNFFSGKKKFQKLWKKTNICEETFKNIMKAYENLKTVLFCK